MIGTNIKKLRLQNGMTQKNLADKLFVSSQAVSRWENGEVEPSIGTVMELAKIFGVTVDEILGLDVKKNSETESKEKEEKEKETQEIPKQFLAVCEQCNRPIYHSNEIIRKDGKVFCVECNKKNIEKKHKEEEEAHLYNIEKGKRRRIFSFVFGGLAAIITLILTLNVGDNIFTQHINVVPASIVSTVSMFTFISCCILNNNFVGEMFLRIATWSIKLPGLIFTFDLDGCLWFIGMKILFAILGFVGGVLMFILALSLSLPISLFVYPYAIITNIKKPDKTYW